MISEYLYRQADGGCTYRPSNRVKQLFSYKTRIHKLLYFACAPSYIRVERINRVKETRLWLCNNRDSIYARRDAEGIIFSQIYIFEINSVPACHIYLYRMRLEVPIYLYTAMTLFRVARLNFMKSATTNSNLTYHPLLHRIFLFLCVLYMNIIYK